MGTSPPPPQRSGLQCSRARAFQAQTATGVYRDGPVGVVYLHCIHSENLRPVAWADGATCSYRTFNIHNFRIFPYFYFCRRTKDMEDPLYFRIPPPPPPSPQLRNTSSLGQQNRFFVVALTDRRGKGAGFWSGGEWMDASETNKQ